MKKSNAKGSRFTVLQDVPAEDNDDTIADKQAIPSNPAPPIVKLWNSFQEKHQKYSRTTSTNLSDSAPTSTKVDARNVPNVSAPSSSGSKHISRPPLQDVSNARSKLSTKSSGQTSKTARHATNSAAKRQSNVSKKLSFGNVEEVFGGGIAGVFGHCPPEPGVELGISSSTGQVSDSIIEQIFDENSNLATDENLSSSDEDEMVNE